MHEIETAYNFGCERVRNIISFQVDRKLEFIYENVHNIEDLSRIMVVGALDKINLYIRTAISNPVSNNSIGMRRNISVGNDIERCSGGHLVSTSDCMFTLYSVL